MVFTTSDGFTFERQEDGTYTDGWETYTYAELVANGHDTEVAA